MFIQLSEFNFAHGQPTCKALYLADLRATDTVVSADVVCACTCMHGWVLISLICSACVVVLGRLLIACMLLVPWLTREVELLLDSTPTL